MSLFFLTWAICKQEGDNNINWNDEAAIHADVEKPQILNAKSLAWLCWEIQNKP